MGDIKEFIRGNDIFRKIEAALENVRVGQGEALFEGLQNGKCTLDFSYNGAYVLITPHAMPTPIPEQTIKVDPADRSADESVEKAEPEPLTEDQGIKEAGISEDTPESAIPDEPRTRRKRRE